MATRKGSRNKTSWSLFSMVYGIHFHSTPGRYYEVCRQLIVIHDSKTNLSLTLNLYGRILKTMLLDLALSPFIPNKSRQPHRMNHSITCSAWSTWFGLGGNVKSISPKKNSISASMKDNTQSITRIKAVYNALPCEAGSFVELSGRRIFLKSATSKGPSVIS